MTTRNNGKISKERVDIEKEASELSTYSEGSLELLDKKNKIEAHWFKEKAVVWLSICVITLLLLVGIFSLAFSQNEETLDWSRQTLSALLGFAAGAIWNAKAKSG